MKIWCTYFRAGSLISGGLERVEVWFAKPEWIIESRLYWYDSPFEDTYKDPTKGVITRQGWFREYESGEKHERQYFSFAKVFGYGDDSDPQKAAIALHVWAKLGEFFGTDNTLKWDDIEDAGKLTIPQTHQPFQFLLEVDLDIILKS
jgi:hypothetical protein